MNTQAPTPPIQIVLKITVNMPDMASHIMLENDVVTAASNHLTGDALASVIHSVIDKYIGQTLDHELEQYSKKPQAWDFVRNLMRTELVRHAADGPTATNSN